MDTKKISTALSLGVLLMFAAFSHARAWPDMPPAKAFISGPGIEGQAQITDGNVLEILRLGSIEDMNHGAIEKPSISGEGFKIIRYFEGGEFRYGDLTYYPDGAGARSVVLFQDGPMVDGDGSPYHDKWLYATRRGDEVLKTYLHQLGATLPDPTQAQMKTENARAVADAIPEKIRVNQPVTLGFTLAQNFKIAPVEAYREGDTHRTVLAASASGAPGHYEFTYAFPKAGIWNWFVRASYNDPEIPMPALTVVDANESVAPVPAQEVKPAPELVQTDTAIVKPAIEPLTLGLGIVAAAIGIIGVVVVLQRQNREK